MASESSSSIEFSSAEQILEKLRKRTEGLRKLAAEPIASGPPDVSVHEGQKRDEVLKFGDDEEDDEPSFLKAMLVKTKNSERLECSSESLPLDSSMVTEDDISPSPIDRPKTAKIDRTTVDRERLQKQPSISVFSLSQHSTRASQQSDELASKTRKRFLDALEQTSETVVQSDEKEEDLETFWSEGVRAELKRIWEEDDQHSKRTPSKGKRSVSAGPSSIERAEENGRKMQKSEDMLDGEVSLEAKTRAIRGKRLFARARGEVDADAAKARVEPSIPIPSKRKFVVPEEEEGGDLEDIESNDIRPNFGDDNVAAVRGGAVEYLDLGGGYRIHGWANRYLRPYQRDGVRFMFRNASQRTGAILNDDMGLGKTVQVISLLLAVLDKCGTIADHKMVKARRRLRAELERSGGEGFTRAGDGDGPILIVVPKSVINQWNREIDTWGYFDWIDMSKLLPTLRIDALKLCHPKRKGSHLVSPEIVLLPYSHLSIKSNAYLKALVGVPFKMVVFDEVHVLKNSASLQAKTARLLKSSCRIGLTGTIMQNSLKEFWSVLKTINPKGVLSWNVFNEEYAKPLNLARAKNATEEILKIGKQKAIKIRMMMDKYILRRSKMLIKDQMPIKRENVVFCKMTPLQQNVYGRIANGRDGTLLRFAKEPCPCGRKFAKRGMCCFKGDPRAPLWREFHPDGDVCSRCPYCLQLPLISKLINCCNHLDLLKVTLTADLPDKIEAKRGFAEEVFGPDLEAVGGAVQTVNFDVMTLPDLSGKLKVLGELLQVWQMQPNSRVLVFSHYTRILDIIGKFLDRRGMYHCRLDGKTSSDQRQEIVDSFNDLGNSKSFVFMISTKAGSLGLNLTAANIVVLFDSGWNPAFDVQAQDRAYRLGQVRDVDVYRLISTGTIEDKTYCRQLYKMQLNSEALEGNKEERFFEGVMGDKRRQGELFGVHNLVDYNPDGHLAQLRRQYQWRNPVEPTVTDRAVSTSKSMRAAMQAASRSNFEIEPMEARVNDGEKVDEKELDLSQGKNSPDEDIAEMFAKAYGLPLDDPAVEESRVKKERHRKPRNTDLGPKGVGSLRDRLEKFIESGQGDFSEADFEESEFEEELVTEDEEGDDFLDDGEVPMMEDRDDDFDEADDEELGEGDLDMDNSELMQSRIHDIIQHHSHMAVDSKDLLAAGSTSAQKVVDKEVQETEMQ